VPENAGSIYLGLEDVVAGQIPTLSALPLAYPHVPTHIRTYNLYLRTQFLHVGIVYFSISLSPS
jgi:hypothetical protein